MVCQKIKRETYFPLYFYGFAYNSIWIRSVRFVFIYAFKDILARVARYVSAIKKKKKTPSPGRYSSLTLVKPIRYAVEHGRRTGVGDPDDPAVTIPVDFVVQVVLVDEHQPAARRRPSSFLHVNLLATVVQRGLGDRRQRHAIPVNSTES